MANLTALLEKEASAEIDTILSEAHARASEIVAQAEEEARALTAQGERLAQTQAEASKVRAKSAAQLEASSLRLRAQHEAVEGVFSAVEAELRSLIKNGRRYNAVFEALLSEALEAVGGPERVAKVIVHPDDAARARKIAEGRALADKIETDEGVQGGVKLQATANVTVENTLFDRLQAAREELASDVSKLLMAEAEGAQGSAQGA
jgi:vacuolar-type H+-ATPase subunit E/Vma4